MRIPNLFDVTLRGLFWVVSFVVAPIRTVAALRVKRLSIYSWMDGCNSRILYKGPKWALDALEIPERKRFQEGMPMDAPERTIENNY
jgi:hypothetical protein